MVRRLVTYRSASPRTAYPRPGEPIVPRLLREILDDRHAPFLWEADGGADAWARVPPETCRRMGMAVVDRMQTRLAAMPDALLDVSLPAPAIVLGYCIERRTTNTLRRAVENGQVGGPWTLRRYLALPRFGGRAVVDLLSAVEASGGRARRPPELEAERRSSERLAELVRRLPVSTVGLRAELGTFDGAELARFAARAGLPVPYRTIEIGGTRVLVKPAQVTAARAAYHFAARAVHRWGAATIRSIAAQLRELPGSSVVAVELVDRLLRELECFRWIDRRAGWFWFVGRPNGLLVDAKKILAVRPRISRRRFWAALFRSRTGPRPSLDALPAICREIAGVQLLGDAVTVEQPFERREHLTDVELTLVTLLNQAPGALPMHQLEAEATRAGISSTALARAVRRSPLVTISRRGQVRAAWESH